MSETEIYDWDDLYPRYMQFQSDLWSNVDERPDVIPQAEFPKYILSLTADVRAKTIEDFSKGWGKVQQERSDQLWALRESKKREAEQEHGKI